MPSDHVTAASPLEPQPEVATDALALTAGGIADCELIAALGIEAQLGVDLGRNAAAEFQPCRLLQQRHRNGRPGKGRRCVSAPVSPDIGPNIGLADLSPGMVHWPRTPSRPVVPEVEPRFTEVSPSLASLNPTCCQMTCA